jgi:ligand-binding sensor protein
VNDEGKVEKVKTEKAEGESEGNSEVTESEKPLQFDLATKAGLIDALEMIMIATHAAGFTKAADLIMQAQASIGRGE